MAQSTLEVRRDIERIRAELDETLDALGDHVRPSRIAERRTRRLRHGMSSMRERVMGSASSMASTAGGGLQSAQSQMADTAREAPQWVAQETRGNPLVAGMVSFGIGLLLGSLAPATKVERQAVDAMSDQLEPVREQALDAAQSVRQQATEAAQDAAEHLKGDVQGAAQGVQETASESARAVQEQARSSAHEVAETRRSS